jgi:hypothetical protein
MAVNSISSTAQWLKTKNNKLKTALGSDRSGGQAGVAFFLL